MNTSTRTETLLYTCRGSKRDGGTPVGGVAPDGEGNLYGTTIAGGSSGGDAGNGVVFKLNISTKTYTVVHTFTGPDGSQPTAAPLPDGKGNFYGTTYVGGAHGYGTVWELNSAGTLITLYSFTGGMDGAYPMDSSGNLYGAATGGGQYGWGTLFEITP